MAQLSLQRRILEVMAEREAELLRLRRTRAPMTERDSDVAPGADERPHDGARRGLRDRWLAAKERVVECEARVADLERALADAAAGRASGDAATHAPDRPFAACTIVCRNYLAHARALLESLERTEPQVRRYLLVLDAEPGTVDVPSGVEVVSPRRLEVPDFPGMSFKYGVVEFNTAVKPYLLSLLFDGYGEEEVVYFDPDILVLRRLDELRAAMASADIVLTPHITRPIPDDGLTPTEPDIMVSGAYNLGFIGVRRSDETRRFLAWWEHRLEDGCRIDVPNGLFTDQKWIDLVPGLFPGTRLLRDPTYNVAFWNLHERAVDWDGHRYLINGSPAAFVHISGFDPERPDLLSKHQTRTRVKPGSGLAYLLEDYAARLKRHDWEIARHEEYGYDRFADGTRVHPILRQLYLELPADQRAQLGDPFRDLGETGFREWAVRPRPECGGLSYFLQQIYALRVDLQEAFPDVRGRDRDAFIEWARTQGPLEMRYDASLARAPDDSAEAARRTSGAAGDPSGAFRVAEEDPRHYAGMVDRIRQVVDDALPAGATIAVVSRGDYRLMHLGGRQAWHFPRDESGLYAGFHPRTSEDAISHLESLRAAGADYLLFPATSAWWLEHYADFRDHLETRYVRSVDRPEVCVVYELNGRTPRPLVSGTAATEGTRA